MDVLRVVENFRFKGVKGVTYGINHKGIKYVTKKYENFNKTI